MAHSTAVLRLRIGTRVMVSVSAGGAGMAQRTASLRLKIGTRGINLVIPLVTKIWAVKRHVLRLPSGTRGSALDTTITVVTTNTGGACVRSTST